MGQNVTIQGASYEDVPAVNLPKTGGGMATFVDTTLASGAATAVNIQNGYSAYVNGNLIVGNAALATATVEGTKLVLTNGFPVSV